MVQRRLASLLLALIGAASVGRALPAHADVKLLSCSQAPGGQETLRFRIDYDRSIVMWPQLGSPPELAAQITSETVVWERPRYEDGGLLVFGSRWVLDRYNGQLRVDNHCLERDWDICTPGYGYVCKAIEDKPML